MTPSFSLEAASAPTPRAPRPPLPLPLPILILLLLLLLLLLCVPTSLAAVPYVDAFLDIQPYVVWPTPKSDRHNISSTFGPRVGSSSSSSGSHDFHRGVDARGKVGDPVLACYNGTVVKISHYATGGLTVVLRHEFRDWARLRPDGGLTKRWYTLHMHLASAFAIEGEDVMAGRRIGTMGESGNVVSPHLHHEVRIGTGCTLERAPDDPSILCNPRVSPFLVYGRIIDGYRDVVTITEEVGIGPGSDGVVGVSTSDVQPFVNGYLIERIASDGISVVDSHELDLNLRIGFNLTSMDTPDTSKPYLRPVEFGYTATEWATRLVIPAVWVGSKGVGEVVKVTVSDVWGNSAHISLGDASDGW